jgi:hypothetical protein
MLKIGDSSGRLFIAHELRSSSDFSNIFPFSKSSKTYSGLFKSDESFPIIL